MRKILLGTIASIFIFSAGTSEAVKLYTVGSKMQNIINEACPSGTEKIRTVINSFNQMAATADISHSSDQQVSSFSNNIRMAANYLNSAISKTYGMGSNSGYNNFVKSINSVRQATWNVQRMQDKSWLSALSSIIENLSSVVNGMQDIITTKRPYIKSVSERLNDLNDALTLFTNDLSAASANASDTEVLVPEATPPQTNTGSLNSDLNNQLLQQQLQQQQQQFQLLQQQIQQQQQLLNQYQQPTQQPTLNNTLVNTQPVQQVPVEQPVVNPTPAPTQTSTRRPGRSRR